MVDETVLIANAPGPIAGKPVFERFRLTAPSKWVAHDLVHSLCLTKNLFPFPLKLSESLFFNRFSHISEKGLIKMEVVQGI